jgi:S1-C subfamily serine protease
MTRNKPEKLEKPKKPRTILIRYLVITLFGFICMVGTTTALAQEPRHIEIRIINPSPSSQQPQKQDSVTEFAQDKAAPGSGPSVQSDDISQMVLQSKPAVVTIIAGQRLGSGFFVSSDGYVLTNSHVIQDSRPTIRLADGKSVSASMVRNDEGKDLALLRASGSDYPTLPLGDSSKALQGESVIAIGSPIGLEGTVTRGIISAIRKGPNGITYIQTDAAVSPGNSGGPLLNKFGQVIGINTMKSNQPDTERLGFAISINDAKQFMGR